MTTNEELFNRIRESLELAQKTLKVKEKIESDILKILQEVRKMTGGGITFDVSDFNKERHFSSSDKIVYISKSGMHVSDSYILFGFSIDKNLGFPVNIETEESLFNCENDEVLKRCIGDIISDEKNAMLIVSIALGDPEIPF